MVFPSNLRLKRAKPNSHHDVQSYGHDNHINLAPFCEEFWRPSSDVTVDQVAVRGKEYIYVTCTACLQNEHHHLPSVMQRQVTVIEIVRSCGHILHNPADTDE
ncbi:hypothetical protein TNCV_4503221 [Trichonephila clavipes]|nr:hypothetical protein TNCV_4503221 [Trichonephila clavipes]